jgi:hypothetical protein
LVALDVALVLEQHVLVVGLVGPRVVDLYRVVDHQFDRDQRFHLRGRPTQPGDGVAHGRQVHHGRHPGEVLHQDALGGEGDLMGRVAGGLAVSLGVGAPGGHRRDVVRGDVRALLVAQQVLEYHLDRIRQAVDVVGLAQRGRAQGEDLVLLAADRQGGAGAEGVRVWAGWGIRCHLPILPWVTPRPPVDENSLTIR